MASLNYSLQRVRRGLQVLLASAIISAGCSNDENLRALGYCQVQDNHDLEEICGNPYQEGSCNPDITEGCDDNCDGQLDEVCDVDGDGYCTDKNIEGTYELGNIETYLTTTCAQTFQLCDEFQCEPITDCDDHNAGIHPGALEICNAYDDDCDGELNESFPESADYCGTLDGLLDGIGICTLGHNECIDGIIECVDEQLSGQESCDGLDNDCDGTKDNNEANMEVNPDCFYEWLPNGDGTFTKTEGDPSTIYVGLCRPGVETCTITCAPNLPSYDLCVTGEVGGDQMCWGAYVAKEDICDGYNNDCDDWTDEDYDIDRDGVATCFDDCDDNDPEIHPGHEEIGCDGKDNNCDGVELEGTDLDLDTFSPEGGLCGPVDCNDSNPEVYPGHPEICDCEDNNCNGEVDEGLHSEVPIDWIVGTDCSGSMSGRIGGVESDFSNADIPPCFSGPIINVSNVMIGNPPYPGTMLGTVEDFQNNYAGEVPNGNCSGAEPTLTYVAYAACAVSGMDSNQTCLDIASQNPFTDSSGLPSLTNQIWRPNSDKYLVLVTDEPAQWYGPSPALNQAQVAALVRQAGIIVDVYTLPQYFNRQVTADWTRPDPNERQLGFGELVYDSGGNQVGNLYDLNSGTLSIDFRNGFIDRYCNNT